MENISDIEYMTNSKGYNYLYMQRLTSYVIKIYKFYLKFYKLIIS